MKENPIDSSLLDKAIKFAVDSHKNVERRQKGFPYIIHPLEVVSIVSLLSNDQNLLAAAALHDVVEDCDVSLETIRNEFNEKVAHIVEIESDIIFDDSGKEKSWKEKKIESINRIKNADRDSQIVALGDKLSNMRAIYYDYLEIGNKIWDRFHEKDIKEHEWHYRFLAEALQDLSDTYPYKEFVGLINKVFGYKENLINNFFSFDACHFNKNEPNIINCENVIDIPFLEIKKLLELTKKGYSIFLFKPSLEITNSILKYDIDKKIDFIRYIDEKTLKQDFVESGEGYNSKCYFSNIKDDLMLKLYKNNVSLLEIKNEKDNANKLSQIGLKTPFVGDIVLCGDKYGLIYERIVGKISIAKYISLDKNNIDKAAQIFAKSCLKIHSIKIDNNLFKSSKNEYMNWVKAANIFTPQEKEKIVSFLESVKDDTHLLHGDLQMGNIILNSQFEPYFIDLNSVCVGDIYFDLASVYYACHCLDEKLANYLYHCNKETLLNFYEKFIRYYFFDKDEKFIETFEKDIIPFVGLKNFYFAYEDKWHNEMIDMVKDFLLK